MIAVGLLAFQFFGGGIISGADARKLDSAIRTSGEQMLAKGDVAKLDLVTNKNLIRVYIKSDSLNKPYYQEKKSKGAWPNVAAKADAPQFEFQVIKIDEYEKG